MVKKRKSKYRKTTRDTFYRPKNAVNREGEISIRCFKRFLNNFSDPNVWGNDKNYFYYHSRTGYNNGNHTDIDYRRKTKEAVNRCLTFKNKYGHPTLRGEYNLTEFEISLHIHSDDKRDRVFYTNSTRSHTPLICFDIDPLDDGSTTDADLMAVVKFLLTLHPNSYWEYSTNGRGIHFYVLLDFSSSKIEYSHFNNIFKEYGDILRLYINNSFSLNFDAIKATYSGYTWSDTHSTFIIAHCGSLCKLPRPRFLAEYNTLYSIPFTPLSQLNDNGTHLNLLIEQAGIVEPPKVVVSSISPPLSLPITNVLGKKTGKEKKISMTGDSFQNEKDYISIAVVEYYKKNNERPMVDDVYNNYISDTGYQKQDADRYQRFVKAFDYIVNVWFDPSKIVSKNKRKIGMYIVGDYITDIKKLYPTKEYMKAIQREVNPDYKGRIRYEDICIAAGFYFVSLTRLLESKNNTDRDFTVAQNNMIGWFDNLYDKKQTKRRCQRGEKVSVLRDILIKMKWLECVDKSYQTGRRSRRHLLTEMFPRYGEFEQIATHSKIKQWKWDIDEMGATG